jgi:hypothetical protein
VPPCRLMILATSPRPLPLEGAAWTDQGIQVTCLQTVVNLRCGPSIVASHESRDAMKPAAIPRHLSRSGASSAQALREQGASTQALVRNVHHDHFMNTWASCTAILITVLCTACGDIGDVDEGSTTDELSEAESAVTATAWSCTVEKSDAVYRAEARITDGRLAVLLDGMVGRSKNNIGVSARYPGEATVDDVSIRDDRPSNQWIDVPVFLQKGAEIAIGVRFDLAGFDRECKLDIKL